MLSSQRHRFNMVIPIDLEKNESTGNGNCWHFVIACNKFIDLETVFLTLAFVSECVLFHTTFANNWWNIGLLN